MKKITIQLIALTITFSAAAQKQPQSSDPHYLKTGWYYVSETKTDYPMTLNKTKEVYFINPEIIVSVKHFIKIEHVKNDPKKSWGPSLIMRFDKTGTDTWSIATDKAIGKKLALIIDNGLV